MQVHTWAEDDVAAVFLGFVADGLADFGYKISVPGGGETRADGEGCGVVGLVGTFAGGVDAHTGWAVGEHGGWDAETRDGGRCACSTCHEVGLAAYDGSCAEEVVGSTHK